MTRDTGHPLTIIAIDDEPLALARLELLLHDMPDVRLVASSCNPDDALALVVHWSPDILLLDIEMPGMDGVELASRLNIMEGPRPMVIFVTAFDHHALAAFQSQAIDYVLKPVTPARLEQTLARAATLVHHRQSNVLVGELQRQIGELLDSRETYHDRRDREEVWALRGRDFVPLRVGDIEHVISERDFVHIHNSERAFLLRTSLGALHARLGHDRFIRVRRSAIVRLDRIEFVRDRGYGDLQIRLRSGTLLQAGRTYLKPLRERLKMTAA